MKTAVLTVSDGMVANTRENESDNILVNLLETKNYKIERRVVANEANEIAAAIASLAENTTLVLTTGGTGVAPRNVTPETTRSVIDRKTPGIAKAIRADSFAKTPHALLSREIAGVLRQTLVVNLPRSPGGCHDGFAVLKPTLAHTLGLLADAKTTHRQT